MNKQPFIINVTETDLPNLAEDKSGNFGFTFDKINEWSKDKGIISLLSSMDEKLANILLYLNKNGRE